MQPANNFIVLNIREYLENGDKRLGEDTTLVKWIKANRLTRQAASNETEPHELVQLLRLLQ